MEVTLKCGIRFEEEAIQAIQSPDPRVVWGSETVVQHPGETDVVETVFFPTSVADIPMPPEPIVCYKVRTSSRSPRPGYCVISHADYARAGKFTFQLGEHAWIHCRSVAECQRIVLDEIKRFLTMNRP